MTEQEYIDITDLARLRIIQDALRVCMQPELDKVSGVVTRLILKLENKTIKKDNCKELEN